MSGIKFKLLQIHWVTWLFVALGAVTYVSGFSLKEVKFANLNIGEVLSHTGFLIAVVKLFHWLFEYQLMRGIVGDIVASVTGSRSLAESGICDITDNSRDIYYSDHIANDKNLMVCVQYSPRFLEDNFHKLSGRVDQNKSLKIVALSQNAKVLDFLGANSEEKTHIRPDMAKIRNLVRDLTNSGVNAELIEHDKILRYSFVVLDRFLWIKFYKNANGRTEIPAIKIKRSTGKISNFFEEDIEQLINSTV